VLQRPPDAREEISTGGAHTHFRKRIRWCRGGGRGGGGAV